MPLSRSAMRQASPRPPWSKLAIRLMIACAALGTLAAAEVANGAPPQAAVRSEKGVPSLPLHDKTEQDFSLPQLSAFPEITQRPLFNGTRRPALAADQSGQAWSTFVLQGVI